MLGGGYGEKIGTSTFNMIVSRVGGYPSKMETIYYLATNILCVTSIDSEVSMNAAVRHISAEVQTVYRRVG